MCYKESRRAAEESESLLPADACDRLAPHCLLTMRSHVYQLSIQQFFVSVSVQSHLTQLPLLVHRHLICHCSSSSRHVIWANPWIKTSIHVFFKTVALVLMSSCLYLYRCQFPHTAVIDFPLNNPELGTKICPHPPTRFKDTGCIMQSSTSHSSNIRWQIHHNWLTIHCCFRAMWDLNQSKHRLQTQYGTLLCLVNM